MPRRSSSPPTFSLLDISLEDRSFDNTEMTLARKYNESYLHWNELRYRDCGTSEPERIWALMKLLRMGSSTVIKLPDQVLSYSMPNCVNMMLHEIDMNLSVGFMPGDPLDSNKRLMYAISSMMEESIASSQIEGAVTTTKVAKNMLRNGREPKDRSELMIRNNYNAMQYIKTRADEPLTPELIRSVHAIISKGTMERSEFEGTFRKDNSIAVRDPLTGETYHEPVDYTVIDSMIQGLCDFINSDDHQIHPVVKGIVIHFVIAYIHPFMDGNGRVSRSLFYWYLIKRGYDIVEYLAISKAIMNHRGKYDQAYQLSETDDNDITYFIRYNLERIIESIGIFSDYLHKKMEDHERVSEMAHDLGLGKRQADILADLMSSGEPASAYELSVKYQISSYTVRRDLNLLMDMDLVAVSGNDGHKKLYKYIGSLKL